MDPSELPKLSMNAVFGCCRLCGEGEKENKRFLICGHSLCMYKYYHIQCMTKNQIASDKQVGNPCWYCPSCLCRVCFLDVNDKDIILCDECDEGRHLYCLKPPRTRVPKGEWLCASCNAQRKEQEKMGKYEEKMLKLHRKDDDGAMVQCTDDRGVYLLAAAARKLEEPGPSESS